jgi:hypothetical protein
MAGAGGDIFHNGINHKKETPAPSHSHLPLKLFQLLPVIFPPNVVMMKKRKQS